PPGKANGRPVPRFGAHRRRMTVGHRLCRTPPAAPLRRCPASRHARSRSCLPQSPPSTVALPRSDYPEACNERDGAHARGTALYPQNEGDSCEWLSNVGGCWSTALLAARRAAGAASAALAPHAPGSREQFEEHPMSTPTETPP